MLSRSGSITTACVAHLLDMYVFSITPLTSILAESRAYSCAFGPLVAIGVASKQYSQGLVLAMKL